MPPVFTQAEYHLEWEENKPPGFLIQIEAEDPDTDSTRLKYSLSGRPNPPEAEQKIKVYSNGSVVTTDSFDAESMQSFTADVKVTDGNSEAYAQLWVNISDLNDNDPILNVTDSSVFSVPENSESGAVVATIGATDPDISNRGFTFWLGNGGQGKFSLDQTSGVLTVSGRLDRRVATSYNLTLHASDYGAPPRIVQATVSVAVEDSNTGPVFLNSQGDRTSQFEFNVTEDAPVGKLLGILRAFDPDTGSSGDLSFRSVLTMV
ncbi:protocadherin-16 [Elysia marginata]|uniref:Protocadherin-16 n=1 Tax=Elysia marginata TaxID=1093978 RepID=A0AAV4IA46_9GAST|nr:protocadherin-16 [Elysia marginata]